MRSIKRFARACVIWTIAFLVLGNLFVLGASVWARERVPSSSRAIVGIENLRIVDRHLWRGSAPDEDGYRALASSGIRTIVDLRAEADLDEHRGLLRDLGLRVVAIPIRDGQAPTPAQVRRFLAVVDHSRGGVYVHCMAGVGRTGTMVGAYLVHRDHLDPGSALEHNLSVGPPSLEQLAFVSRLEGATIERAPTWVTAVSRVLDGPRRLWVNLRGYGADASSVAMLVMAITLAWMLSKVESVRHPRSLLWA